MDAISLFSGVGGMDRGLETAGIRTVLQAESDPWCRAVLERHFPCAERVSDVRDVGATAHSELREAAGQQRHERWSAQPDLVHGGFPCQDVSVAGKRAGFRGERSSLWFEFYRVLSELRPRWTLIENVPGLLSSHSGRDFGTVLSGLVELGYGVAWRTLDAQHFGVPQRRRRVFIVGCLGDPGRAAAVLAVCEGCDGDSAAGSETGQELAYSLEARSGGIKPAWNTTYLTSPAQGARDWKGIGNQDLNEHLDERLIVANAVRASEGHHGHSSPRGDGADNLIAAPLTAGDHPHSNLPGRHREDDENLAVIAQGVRRLTPLECERLMGWPDEWTRWTADGREVPDSVRYRMCGNGVVSTVAEWIGWRLQAVEALA